MHVLTTLLRLGLGGLFLEPQAYREQRDAPDGFRRGLLLVLAVGLLVGVASFLGDLGELLSQPNPAVVTSTVYEGIKSLPVYNTLLELDPATEQQFEALYQQIIQLAPLLNGSVLGSLIGVLTVPLRYLLGWLIFGGVAHLVARSLGGRALIGQTLACTALAVGVNLLGVIQLIPFAQLAGTTLLGLFACYVAIREAHGLPPWRAFWATVLGPVLLVVLLAGLACLGFFLLIGAISAAVQGG